MQKPFFCLVGQNSMNVEEIRTVKITMLKSLCIQIQVGKPGGCNYYRLIYLIKTVMH